MQSKIFILKYSLHESNYILGIHCSREQKKYILPLNPCFSYKSTDFSTLNVLKNV